MERQSCDIAFGLYVRHHILVFHSMWNPTSKRGLISHLFLITVSFFRSASVIRSPHPLMEAEHETVEQSHPRYRFIAYASREIVIPKGGLRCSTGVVGSLCRYRGVSNRENLADVTYCSGHACPFVLPARGLHLRGISWVTFFWDWSYHPLRLWRTRWPDELP